MHTKISGVDKSLAALGTLKPSFLFVSSHVLALVRAPQSFVAYLAFKRRRFVVNDYVLLIFALAGELSRTTGTLEQIVFRPSGFRSMILHVNTLVIVGGEFFLANGAFVRPLGLSQRRMRLAAVYLQ